MRVLYITSGHSQPYPHRFIDQFIGIALGKVAHRSEIFYWDESPDRVYRLIQLVKEFLPEYIFTIHGLCMNDRLVKLLKSYGAKVGIWFIDDPYDIDDSKGRLFEYDFIFTNEADCVPFYQKRGYKKTFYLPLGTEPDYYFPLIAPEKYKSDICFVGSPFPKRIELLRYLYRELPELHIKVVGPFWEQYLPAGADYVNYHFPPEEIRKYYCGTKINLNIHREAHENIISGVNLNTENIPAGSPNNRTFDIAATGAFQLVDYRVGLSEKYDLKTEIAVFRSKEDLVKKIHYFIDKIDEREVRAQAAYKRTREQNCFYHRLTEMIQLVEIEIRHERWHLMSPEILSRGKLIKGTGPAVYFLYNGKKYLIPSEQTFRLLEFRWEDLQIIPQDQLESIPNGITF